MNISTIYYCEGKPLESILKVVVFVYDLKISIFETKLVHSFFLYINVTTIDLIFSFFLTTFVGGPKSVLLTL